MTAKESKPGSSTPNPPGEVAQDAGPKRVDAEDVARYYRFKRVGNGGPSNTAPTGPPDRGARRLKASVVILVVGAALLMLVMAVGLSYLALR